MSTIELIEILLQKSTERELRLILAYAKGLTKYKNRKDQL